MDTRNTVPLKCRLLFVFQNSPETNIGSGPVAHADDLGDLHEVQRGDEAESDVLEAGKGGDGEVVGSGALAEHGHVQEEGAGSNLGQLLGAKNN